MPVTVKLSRRFYETFGDDLTNELVEWFNAMDLAYRTDLRAEHELTFARFEARMDGRFAEFEARIDQRFVESEARTDKRFAVLEAKVDQMPALWRAEIRESSATLKADLLRAMFLYWIATVSIFFLDRLL